MLVEDNEEIELMRIESLRQRKNMRKEDRVSVLKFSKEGDDFERRCAAERLPMELTRREEAQP